MIGAPLLAFALAASPPDDDAVADAAAPAASAARGSADIWTLDQLRFAMPTHPEQLDALAPAHSLAAAAAILDRLGFAYERRQVTFDSGQLTPAIRDQMRALDPAEPFVLPEGAKVTVNVVLSRQPE